MENEIEPCPLCDSKAYTRQYTDRHPNDGEWDVVCSECDYRLQGARTETRAIQWWNCQAREKLVLNVEQVNELRKILKWIDTLPILTAGIHIIAAKSILTRRLREKNRL